MAKLEPQQEELVSKLQGQAAGGSGNPETKKTQTRNKKGKPELLTLLVLENPNCYLYLKTRTAKDLYLKTRTAKVNPDSRTGSFSGFFLCFYLSLGPS